MPSHVTQVHTLGPLRLNHATTPVDLNGLSDFSSDPGIEEIVSWASGRPAPSFIGAMSIRSMMSFTCLDLKKMLDLSAYDGIPIESAGTYTSVDAYYTKLKKYSTRETSASTNHFRIKVNEGLLLATQISWTQGQEARMQCELHAMFDQTNLPFAYTNNVALPYTPAIDQLWTGGTVSINGTDVPGVVGATLSFGNDVYKEAGGGLAYDTFAGIRQQDWTYEIQTRHVPSLSDFSLEGTAGTSGATITLTKLKKFGTRVAAATEEHILFTVPNNQAYIYCGPYSGSNNQPAEGVIRLRMVEGASPMITVDTTAVGDY